MVKTGVLCYRFACAGAHSPYRGVLITAHVLIAYCSRLWSSRQLLAGAAWAGVNLGQQPALLGTDLITATPHSQGAQPHHFFQRAEKSALETERLN